MKFEWDENKNKLNIQKHQIDFNDVKNIFKNRMLVKEDNRLDYGEKRFIAIALMLNLIVVVVYTIKK